MVLSIRLIDRSLDPSGVRCGGFGFDLHFCLRSVRDPLFHQWIQYRGVPDVERAMSRSGWSYGLCLE